jgi:NADPH:quinone reductase-like Zn-dependent oxidoreductase
LTARQALVDHAGMKSGDDVLIHGGQAALGRTPCRSPLRAEDT